ncbi:MAG TPA: dTDP-4-dehydrorhamnose 3,5-epimerase [Sporomusaceae bacterium]|nr:dTDP-4-dehydrorhamnose 3,5-epimerase [Sporomusaceae bacterium]
MIFTQTPLEGAYIIKVIPNEDERGFFARSVCRDEFESFGLNADFVQQSISWTKYKGTIRGLHYQCEPYQENKLVRVTRGAIFDVIVDIRVSSSTYGQWFGLELSEFNRQQLYIPKGFAHGFQALSDRTEVFYQMTAFYHPQAARGIRWDDKNLNVTWPFTIKSNDRCRLSQADSQFLDWGKSRREN